jgi:hypothetical protein
MLRHRVSLHGPTTKLLNAGLPITKTTDIFKRLTQRDLSLTGGCDPDV